uniref:G_PROTEIN_RECEP_F1_2 domain-containing protein n=1 Tax=Steinernema glaseri TaxID=37863 RepID=A0A1I7ZX67_9BILA
MAELDSHIALSTLRLLITVVSVSGNSLILFVIFKSRRLRSSSPNLLLAQLAFADLVLGISAGTRGVSTMLFQRYGYTSYPAGLCLVLGSPTNLGIHLSQTTVLAIAVDRFLCIQCPAFYRRSDTVLYALTRFLLCATYSVVGVGVSYLGVSFDEDNRVPVCSTGAVMTPCFILPKKDKDTKIQKQPVPWNLKLKNADLSKQPLFEWMEVQRVHGTAWSLNKGRGAKVSPSLPALPAVLRSFFETFG